MKAKFIIISGPSGSGEDSVIEGLKKYFKLSRVVTTVSRKPRKGEKEKKPYSFITKSRFKKMIKKNKFIEWAKVYGSYRGCAYKEIERLKKKSGLIIWKVDWQGADYLKKIMPEIKTIYIAPPSLKLLTKRLIKRGDSLRAIEKRQQASKEWSRHLQHYDYKIINKEKKLKETIQKTAKIIKKELKRKKKNELK